MDLRYVTLRESNLKNRKKLTLVQIMKSKNIVNSVGVFNCSATMNGIFVNNTWMNKVSYE